MLLSGCGTIAATGSRRDEGPLPFDGVHYDVKRVHGGYARWAWPAPFYILDLPASFALDTAILPFTIANALATTRPLELYEVVIAPVATGVQAAVRLEDGAGYPTVYAGDSQRRELRPLASEHLPDLPSDAVALKGGEGEPGSAVTLAGLDRALPVARKAVLVFLDAPHRRLFVLVPPPGGRATNAAADALDLTRDDRHELTIPDPHPSRVWPWSSSPPVAIGASW